MDTNRKKNEFIRSSWKDYFSFSNRTRRGLLVLFTIIALEIATLFYLHYAPRDFAGVDFTAFRKEVDAFYFSHQQDRSATKKDLAVVVKQKSEEPSQLFSFNPNHLPATEWKRLGFSDRQINSIQHYESKGGVFKIKSDVKKMYAISEKEYKRIEPYIALPETTVIAVKKISSSSPKFLTVDIGTADTSELSRLPMVGDYLAEKISSYREKLGGFFSIDQVKEVRGLRDSAYLIIRPHLYLKDSTNLRKININTAGYEELNKHPYINSSVAKVILAFRAQHGPFRKIEDVLKVPLVDAELYRKIAPYLKAE